MAVESLTTQGNLDLQALLTKLSENDMTSSTDAGMLALLNQGKSAGFSPKVEPVVQPIVESSVGMQELLAEIRLMRAELEALKGSAIPETKELTIVEAVSLVLSDEDKVLFASPETMTVVEAKLARYFQTEAGKAAILEFLTYFKG